MITQLTTFVPSTAVPGGPPGIAGPPGQFSAFGVSAQSGVSTYTTAPTDAGKMIVFSATTSGVAVTLTTSAAIVLGWWAIFKNNNTLGALTLTPVTGVIDGQAFITVDPLCSCQLVYTGANFESFGPIDGGTF